jgi:ABC-2 type transport system permease protein
MTTDRGTSTPVQRQRERSAAPWLRQVKTFAVRTVREQFRSRVALFWALGWPVLWYVLTTRLFIQGSGDGLGVAKTTVAVSVGLFGALTVSLVGFAQTLSNDLTEKRYRKLRSLPISPSADLLGRFLGGFALAAVSFALVLGVGFVDSAVFVLRPLSIPIVAGSLILFCVIGMAIATVIASLVDQGEYIVAITNTVLILSFFLTGFNGITPFMLPAKTRSVLNYVPNALAARMQAFYLAGDQVRTALTPPPLPTSPMFIGLLVVYAIGFAAVAVVVMRRSIYAGDAGE